MNSRRVEAHAQLPIPARRLDNVCREPDAIPIKLMFYLVFLCIAQATKSKIPAAMNNLVEFSVTFRILMGPKHKYLGQRFHHVGMSVGTILRLRGFILPMLEKCCFGTSPLLDMLKLHQQGWSSEWIFP